MSKVLSKAEVIAALKTHADKQAALDADEVALVKVAYNIHGIGIEKIAELLGISVRTAYHRLAGKGPRTGTSWR